MCWWHIWHMWWVGGGKDVTSNLGINTVTAIAMIVLHVVVDAAHPKHIVVSLWRRFDFFEAKRRDLLAAARRAREHLLAETKENQNQQLAMATWLGVGTCGILMFLFSFDLRIAGLAKSR